MDLSENSIYKILSLFKNIKLRVEDCLIFDGKSPDPLYLKNDSEGYLTFLYLSDYESLILSWISSNFQIKYSSKSTTFEIVSLKQALACDRSVPCRLQKASNQPSYQINILWSINRNYSIINSSPTSSEIVPITIRNDSETIKNCINKYMNKKNLRLKEIEIIFSMSQGLRFFECIKNWKFSECDSLKRFHNLKTQHSKNPSLPRVISSPRISTSPPETPRFDNKVLSKNESGPIKVDSVDEKIKKIVQKNKSVKYINYHSWKKNIDNGSVLLPNEKLFAKMIVEEKGKKKYDCVKEIKNLSIKMAINLDENKSKRQLQEALKHELLAGWILRQGLNAANLEKIQTAKPKKKTKKVAFADQVSKEIDSAVEKLEKVKKTIQKLKKSKPFNK